MAPIIVWHGLEVLPCSLVGLGIVTFSAVGTSIGIKVDGVPCHRDPFSTISSM